MKKIHKLLAVIMGVLLISQQMSAASLVEASTIVSGGSVIMEMEGTVSTKIISVIMPTRVEFGITPDAAGWNKMLSPDFQIINTGNVTVNISICKAFINTENVRFTTGTPVIVSGVRQVRIGVAPKQYYANVSGLSRYLFTDSVSDSNPINLMNNLDYSSANNTGTFSIYGDLSSGWGFGEKLSISTIFKVNLS